MSSAAAAAAAGGSLMSGNALHAACGCFAPHGADWETVLQLTQSRQGPELCREPDAHGMLPLHYAAESMRLLSADPHYKYESVDPLHVAEALVAAHPEGCRTRDKDRRLPIHIALAFQKDVGKQNHRGGLHHTISSAGLRQLGSVPPMVRALLAEFPEGSLKHDGEGKLPLELAILSSAECETIRVLVAAIGHVERQKGYVEASDGNDNGGRRFTPVVHDGNDIKVGLDVKLPSRRTKRFDGRTPRDHLTGSANQQYRHLAKSVGAYLGRYQLIPPAVHTSRNSQVWRAKDILKDDRAVWYVHHTCWLVRCCACLYPLPTAASR